MTVADRVKLGAALLDRRSPRWRTRIDAARLDMEWGSQCVLSQLFGSYMAGVRAVGLRDAKPSRTSCPEADHGFCTRGPRESYAVLTAEWLKLFQKPAA